MDMTNMYALAQVNPDKVAEVQQVADKINSGKSRYEEVANTFKNGIPWWFIGIIHQLECSGSFRLHLHNGDPLSQRTVHKPAGRPISGVPPFRWEYSAIDALEFKGYGQVHDWSINNSLDLFERYNGLGYRNRGLNSPYLWSYTQFYSKGKYDADNHYNPELISKQAGVVAIMKYMGV